MAITTNPGSPSDIDYDHHSRDNDSNDNYCKLLYDYVVVDDDDDDNDVEDNDDDDDDDLIIVL
jgi:hypothetical protein